jgi:hypothetical protein
MTTYFSKESLKNLGYDISRFIYDLHPIHSSSHKKKLQPVLQQLSLVLLCENCEEPKPLCYKNESFCCSRCYMQSRDDPYRICL